MFGSERGQRGEALCSMLHGAPGQGWPPVGSFPELLRRSQSLAWSVIIIVCFWELMTSCLLLPRTTNMGLDHRNRNLASQEKAKANCQGKGEVTCHPLLHRGVRFLHQGPLGRMKLGEGAPRRNLRECKGSHILGRALTVLARVL